MQALVHSREEKVNVGSDVQDNRACRGRIRIEFDVYLRKCVLETTKIVKDCPQRLTCRCVQYP